MDVAAFPVTNAVGAGRTASAASRSRATRSVVTGPVNTRRPGARRGFVTRSRRRKASARSAAVDSTSVSPMNAMDRWPRATRWSNARSIPWALSTTTESDAVSGMGRSMATTGSPWAICARR